MPESGHSAFAQLQIFQKIGYHGGMTLHPDVARLAETLDAMIALLKLHGDDGWADKIERCQWSIVRSDYHGVEQLLRLYGGMGSLNDLILQSGGAAPAEDNEMFNALRTNAWEQAHTLSRE